MGVFITRKTRALENLKKKLSDLSNKKVESGYFLSSGIHKESGLHYAELMDLHEYGSFIHSPIIPSRPVRSITLSIIENNYSIWSTSIKAFLNNKGSLLSNLNNIGMNITEEAKGIFGSSYLLPNSPITIALKGQGKGPLIDTSDLKNHWTWKVSNKD